MFSNKGEGGSASLFHIYAFSVFWGPALPALIGRERWEGHGEVQEEER